MLQAGVYSCRRECTSARSPGGREFIVRVATREFNPGLRDSPAQSEEPPMEDQLVETWAIHNRTNLYLLNALPEGALTAALPKCRTVYDQFAHVHNVRLLWLKSAATVLL